MKKNLFSKSIFALIAVLSIFFANSCESWFNEDDDFYSEIEEEVRVANAEEIEVFVRYAATKQGVTTPNGASTQKVDVPFTISCSTDTDFGFYKWAAFSTKGENGVTTEQNKNFLFVDYEDYEANYAGKELPESVITFEDSKATETKVTIHETRSDIYIIPIVAERPEYSASLPTAGASGVVRNMAIRIVFSKQMDESTLITDGKLSENIIVSKKASAFDDTLKTSDTAISDLFTSASLSTSKKILTMRLKTGERFDSNTTIEVKITEDVKDIFGYSMAEAYSFQFTTGTAVDSKAPVIVTLTAGVDKPTEWGSNQSDYATDTYDQPLADYFNPKDPSDSSSYVGATASLSDTESSTILKHRTTGEVNLFVLAKDAAEGMSAENRLESDVYQLYVDITHIASVDGSETGTSIGRQTYSYYAGGSADDTERTVDTSQSGYQLSYDLSSMPDGVIRIDVGARDLIGNDSYTDGCVSQDQLNPVKSIYVIKDTTAPDASSQTSKINTVATAVSSVPYHWYNSSTIGSLAVNQPNYATSPILDASHPLGCDPADLMWSFSLNGGESWTDWAYAKDTYKIENASSIAKDGALEVLFRLKDDLGFISTPAALSSVKYDNTAPIVGDLEWINTSGKQTLGATKKSDIDDLLKIPFTETLSGVKTITITFADGSTSEATYKFNDKAVDVTSGIYNPNVTDGSIALTSGTITVAGLKLNSNITTDGAYPIKVKVEDQATNVSNEQSINITLDTSNPVINSVKQVELEKVNMYDGESRFYTPLSASTEGKVETITLEYDITEIGSGVAAISFNSDKTQNTYQPTAQTKLMLTSDGGKTWTEADVSDYQVSSTEGKLTLNNSKNPIIKGTNVKFRLTNMALSNSGSAANILSTTLTDFVDGVSEAKTSLISSNNDVVPYVYVDNQAPSVSGITLKALSTESPSYSGSTKVIAEVTVPSDPQVGSGLKSLTFSQASVAGVTVKYKKADDTDNQDWTSFTANTDYTLSSDNLTITFTKSFCDSGSIIRIEGIDLLSRTDGYVTLSAKATDTVGLISGLTASPNETFKLDRQSPTINVPSAGLLLWEGNIIGVTNGITNHKEIDEQYLLIPFTEEVAGVKSVEVQVYKDDAETSSTNAAVSISVYDSANLLDATVDKDNENIVILENPVISTDTSSELKLLKITIPDAEKTGSSYEIKIALTDAAGNKSDFASVNIQNDPTAPVVEKVEIPGLKRAIELTPFGSTAEGPKDAYWLDSSYTVDSSKNYGQSSPAEKVSVYLTITEETSGIKTITLGGTSELVSGTTKLYYIDASGKEVEVPSSAYTIENNIITITDPNSSENSAIFRSTATSKAMFVIKNVKFTKHSDVTGNSLGVVVTDTATNKSDANSTITLKDDLTSPARTTSTFYTDSLHPALNNDVNLKDRQPLFTNVLASDGYTNESIVDLTVSFPADGANSSGHNKFVLSGATFTADTQIYVDDSASPYDVAFVLSADGKTLTLQNADGTENYVFRNATRTLKFTNVQLDDVTEGSHSVTVTVYDLVGWASGDDDTATTSAGNPRSASIILDMTDPAWALAGGLYTTTNAKDTNYNSNLIYPKVNGTAGLGIDFSEVNGDNRPVKYFYTAANVGGTTTSGLYLGINATDNTALLSANKAKSFFYIYQHGDDSYATVTAKTVLEKATNPTSDGAGNVTALSATSGAQIYSFQAGNTYSVIIADEAGNYSPAQTFKVVKDDTKPLLTNAAGDSFTNLITFPSAGSSDPIAKVYRSELKSSIKYNADSYKYTLGTKTDDIYTYKYVKKQLASTTDIYRLVIKLASGTKAAETLLDGTSVSTEKTGSSELAVAKTATALTHYSIGYQYSNWKTSKDSTTNDFVPYYPGQTGATSTWHDYKKSSEDYTDGTGLVITSRVNADGDIEIDLPNDKDLPPLTLMLKDGCENQSCLLITTPSLEAFGDAVSFVTDNALGSSKNDNERKVILYPGVEANSGTTTWGGVNYNLGNQTGSYRSTTAGGCVITEGKMVYDATQTITYHTGSYKLALAVENENGVAFVSNQKSTDSDKYSGRAKLYWTKDTATPTYDTITKASVSDDATAIPNVTDWSYCTISEDSNKMYFIFDYPKLEEIHYLWYLVEDRVGNYDIHKVVNDADDKYDRWLYDAEAPVVEKVEIPGLKYGIEATPDSTTTTSSEGSFWLTSDYTVDSSKNYGEAAPAEKVSVYLTITEKTSGVKTINLGGTSQLVSGTTKLYSIDASGNESEVSNYTIANNTITIYDPNSSENASILKSSDKEGVKLVIKNVKFTKATAANSLKVVVTDAATKISDANSTITLKDDLASPARTTSTFYTDSLHPGLNNDVNLKDKESFGNLTATAGYTNDSIVDLTISFAGENSTSSGHNKFVLSGATFTADTKIYVDTATSPFNVNFVLSDDGKTLTLQNAAGTENYVFRNKDRILKFTNVQLDKLDGETNEGTHKVTVTAYDLAGWGSGDDDAATTSAGNSRSASIILDMTDPAWALAGGLYTTTNESDGNYNSNLIYPKANGTAGLGIDFSEVNGDKNPVRYFYTGTTVGVDSTSGLYLGINAKDNIALFGGSDSSKSTFFYVYEHTGDDSYTAITAADVLAKATVLNPTSDSAKNTTSTPATSATQLYSFQAGKTYSVVIADEAGNYSPAQTFKVVQDSNSPNMKNSAGDSFTNLITLKVTGDSESTSTKIYRTDVKDPVAYDENDYNFTLKTASSSDKLYTYRYVTKGSDSTSKGYSIVIKLASGTKAAETLLDGTSVSTAKTGSSELAVAKTATALTHYSIGYQYSNWKNSSTSEASFVPYYPGQTGATSTWHDYKKSSEDYTDGTGLVITSRVNADGDIEIDLPNGKNIPPLTLMLKDGCENQSCLLITTPSLEASGDAVSFVTDNALGSSKNDNERKVILYPGVEANSGTTSWGGVNYNLGNQTGSYRSTTAGGCVIVDGKMVYDETQAITYHTGSYKLALAVENETGVTFAKQEKSTDADNYSGRAKLYWTKDTATPTYDTITKASVSDDVTAIPNVTDWSYCTVTNSSPTMYFIFDYPKLEEIHYLWYLVEDRVGNYDIHKVVNDADDKYDRWLYDAEAPVVEKVEIPGLRRGIELTPDTTTAAGPADAYWLDYKYTVDSSKNYGEAASAEKVSVYLTITEKTSGVKTISLGGTSQLVSGTTKLYSIDASGNESEVSSSVYTIANNIITIKDPVANVDIFKNASDSGVKLVVKNVKFTNHSVETGNSLNVVVTDAASLSSPANSTITIKEDGDDNPIAETKITSFYTDSWHPGLNDDVNLKDRTPFKKLTATTGYTNESLVDLTISFGAENANASGHNKFVLTGATFTDDTLIYVDSSTSPFLRFVDNTTSAYSELKTFVLSDDGKTLTLQNAAGTENYVFRNKDRILKFTNVQLDNGTTQGSHSVTVTAYDLVGWASGDDNNADKSATLPRETSIILDMTDPAWALAGGLYTTTNEKDTNYNSNLIYPKANGTAGLGIDFSEVNGDKNPVRYFYTAANVGGTTTSGLYLGINATDNIALFGGSDSSKSTFFYVYEHTDDDSYTAITAADVLAKATVSNPTSDSAGSTTSTPATSATQLYSFQAGKTYSVVIADEAGNYSPAQTFKVVQDNTEPKLQDDSGNSFTNLVTLQKPDSSANMIQLEKMVETTYDYVTYYTYKYLRKGLDTNAEGYKIVVKIASGATTSDIVLDGNTHPTKTKGSSELAITRTATALTHYSITYKYETWKNSSESTASFVPYYPSQEGSKSTWHEYKHEAEKPSDDYTDGTITSRVNSDGDIEIDIPNSGILPPLTLLLKDGCENQTSLLITTPNLADAGNAIVFDADGTLGSSANTNNRKVLMNPGLETATSTSYEVQWNSGYYNWGKQTSTYTSTSDDGKGPINTIGKMIRGQIDNKNVTFHNGTYKLCLTVENETGVPFTEALGVTSDPTNYSGRAKLFWTTSSDKPKYEAITSTAENTGTNGTISGTSATSGATPWIYYRGKDALRFVFDYPKYDGYYYLWYLVEDRVGNYDINSVVNDLEDKYNVWRYDATPPEVTIPVKDANGTITYKAPGELTLDEIQYLVPSNNGYRAYADGTIGYLWSTAIERAGYNSTVLTGKGAFTYESSSGYQYKPCFNINVEDSTGIRGYRYLKEDKSSLTTLPAPSTDLIVDSPVALAWYFGGKTVQDTEISSTYTGTDVVRQFPMNTLSEDSDTSIYLQVADWVGNVATYKMGNFTWKKDATSPTVSQSSTPSVTDKYNLGVTDGTSPTASLVISGSKKDDLNISLLSSDTATGICGYEFVSSESSGGKDISKASKTLTIPYSEYSNWSTTSATVGNIYLYDNVGNVTTISLTGSIDSTAPTFNTVMESGATDTYLYKTGETEKNSTLNEEIKNTTAYTNLTNIGTIPTYYTNTDSFILYPASSGTNLDSDTYGQALYLWDSTASAWKSILQDDTSATFGSQKSIAVTKSDSTDNNKQTISSFTSGTYCYALFDNVGNANYFYFNMYKDTTKPTVQAKVEATKGFIGEKDSVQYFNEMEISLKGSSDTGDDKTIQSGSGLYQYSIVENTSYGDYTDYPKSETITFTDKIISVKIRILLKDYLDNVSELSSLGIFTRDTVAPVYSSGTAVAYNSSSDRMEECASLDQDQSSTDTYYFNIINTKTASVKFTPSATDQISDTDGTYSSAVLGWIEQDNNTTAPTVTSSSDDRLKTSFTHTCSTKSDEADITLSGNSSYTRYYYAVDYAGNVSNAVKVVYKYDDTYTPVIQSATIDTVNNETKGYYCNKSTLTVEVKDNDKVTPTSLTLFYTEDNSAKEVTYTTSNGLKISDNTCTLSLKEISFTGGLSVVVNSEQSFSAKTVVVSKDSEDINIFEKDVSGPDVGNAKVEASGDNIYQNGYTIYVKSTDQTVTLTLSGATDSGSGIDYYAVNAGGTKYSSGKDSGNISLETLNTVFLYNPYAYDKLGNTTMFSNSIRFCLDDAAPTISFDSVGDSNGNVYYDSSNGTVYWNKNSNTIPAINVSFTASDEDSGVPTKEGYYYTKGDDVTSQVASDDGRFTITPEDSDSDSGVIYKFYAVDNVGNVSTTPISLTFEKDTSLPNDPGVTFTSTDNVYSASTLSPVTLTDEGAANVVYYYQASKYATNGFGIKISAENGDTGSGVASVTVSDSGGTAVTADTNGVYTLTSSDETETTYAITVTDNVGNVKTKYLTLCRDATSPAPNATTSVAYTSASSTDTTTTSIKGIASSTTDKTHTFELEDESFTIQKVYGYTSQPGYVTNAYITLPSFTITLADSDIAAYAIVGGKSAGSESDITWTEISAGDNNQITVGPATAITEAYSFYFIWLKDRVGNVAVYNIGDPSTPNENWWIQTSPSTADNGVTYLVSENNGTYTITIDNLSKTGAVGEIKFGGSVYNLSKIEIYTTTSESYSLTNNTNYSVNSDTLTFTNGYLLHAGGKIELTMTGSSPTVTSITDYNGSAITPTAASDDTAATAASRSLLGRISSGLSTITTPVKNFFTPKQKTRSVFLSDQSPETAGVESSSESVSEAMAENFGSFGKNGVNNASQSVEIADNKVAQKGQNLVARNSAAQVSELADNLISGGGKVLEASPIDTENPIEENLASASAGTSEQFTSEVVPGDENITESSDYTKIILAFVLLGLAGLVTAVILVTKRLIDKKDEQRL